MQWNFWSWLSINSKIKLFFVLFFLFILFSVNVFSLIIPLSFFSEKEYLGNNEWKYTKYGNPKYYLNNFNQLKNIDSNFIVSNELNYNYEVNKGLYSLKINRNGNLKATFKNYSLNLKILGFGFYNSNTKKRIIKIGINLSNPVIKNNRVIWSLPYDINYFIEYNNGSFRDVIELPQTLKNYLWANKPLNWDLNHTFIALIYDVNAINLNLKNFDSNKTILIKNNSNKTIFFLPKKKVYHQLHQSGLGDFNNENREWLKKRIYYNGYYAEAIPINALISENGNLTWNATISVNLSDGNDDCGEVKTIPTSLSCTGTTITMDTFNRNVGILFHSIPLDQNTTISEATLTVNYVYSCSPTCENTIYGNNKIDVNHWYLPDNKPSDSNNTINSTSFITTGNFTPNGAYASRDLNVSNIIQELVNSPNWLIDNNLSFNIAYVSYVGFSDNIKINAYENTNPATSMSITYEGTLDPCKPQKNTNWVIDSNLTCINKTIVLGTANTYLDSNSLFTLINSSLFFHGLFSFKLPSLLNEQETYDSNMNCDSTFGASSYPCTNAKNPLTGNYTDSTYYDQWVSANNLTDHNISVNVPTKKYSYVQFPLFWSYSWSSNITIQYFNGIWNTVFSDSDFNHFECGADFNIGSNFCWCDMNIQINAEASKFRVLYAENSYSDGCYFSTYDGAVGMGNITPFYINPPARKKYLILTDSNIIMKR